MSIECDMSRVPHSRGVQCGVLLDRKGNSVLPLVRACSLSGDFTNLYFALGIIALSFPVIFVSNRIYVAPASRESEFPRTRVAT